MGAEAEKAGLVSAVTGLVAVSSRESPAAIVTRPKHATNEAKAAIEIARRARVSRSMRVLVTRKPFAPNGSRRPWTRATLRASASRRASSATSVVVMLAVLFVIVVIVFVVIVFVVFVIVFPVVVSPVAAREGVFFTVAVIAFVGEPRGLDRGLDLTGDDCVR